VDIITVLNKSFKNVAEFKYMGQAVKGKVKVKLSLCLTIYHTMKTYWGVEV